MLKTKISGATRHTGGNQDSGEAAENSGAA